MLLAFLIISYIIGSFFSAVLVAKFMRLPSPCSHGSCNPGFSNMLRLYGKKAATFTLLGDILKGFFPIVLVSSYSNSHIDISLVFLANSLGCIWPMFGRYKGGKAIAALSGSLLAISLKVALVWAVIWVLVAYVSRYASAASLLSVWSLLFIIPWSFSYSFLIGLIPIIILITYKHKDNIKRILKGQENLLNF